LARLFGKTSSFEQSLKNRLNIVNFLFELDRRILLNKGVHFVNLLLELQNLVVLLLVEVLKFFGLLR